MMKRSFNIRSVSAVIVFLFLATPLSAFALTPQQTQQLATLLVLQQSGTITAQDAQTLLLLQQLQNQQQPYYGQGQQPYRGQQQQGGGGAGGLGQALLLSSVLGGQGGGALGGASGVGSLAGLALLGGLGGGGGGGGASGAVGQALTLAGAITGNMGLLLAGMITSMIGGLAGGAGATPQRGAVDEQYVAPGQAGPYGGSGSNNPYYTTPTPNPVSSVSPSPAASCEKSIFIANLDQTKSPRQIRPYPLTTSISRNGCILAINTDSVATLVRVVREGQTTRVDQTINAEQSHIFRFETQGTYSVCLPQAFAVTVDGTACSTVTVQ